MEPKIKNKKWKAIAGYSIGAIFILIVLGVASLPFFALKPEGGLGIAATLLICLILLLIEVLLISLAFAKIKQTQDEI